MNTPRFTSCSGLLRRLLLTFAASSFGLAAALAQSGPGSIFGRISDLHSKLTLSGARVTVVGTTLEAFSDQQGNYALPNVPAGPAAVSVSYVGYPTQTLPVTVVAGQAARVDATFAAEVVKLDAFVITGSAVGSARAINDERSAPALTNIVAADAIGQLPDKNVAEALERVPGVDIARDKGEGRYVIIRGLDPAYIGVSMNGVRMSTSEKGSREAALDTISSSMIASIEVNKVNTPDMDTDDMGGSVNLKTRTGFDQTGTQLMISSGGNYSHQEDRTGGYNEQVNFATDELDGGNLGVALDLAADYRPFTDYAEPATGWAQVKSPTDGQLHWILSSQDFRHYDAKRWRDALSTALDFKLTPTSRAWIRFFTTSYTERNNQWLTTFPFGAGTVQALTDTTATVSIKAAGLIKSEAQITNNKREQSLVGGYDDTVGTWTNHLTTAYTTGKYTRPTVTLAYANTAPTVVSYAFDGSYNNTVAQVSGPPIDNPASYAFSTKSSFTQTTADMHEQTVKDDLRDDFDLSGFPAFLQVGAEFRNKNNDENTFKEAITSAPGTLAAKIFSGDDVEDTAGNFPDMRLLPQAVQNFYPNQNSYGQTLTPATTYGGAFRALEQISAGYAMGGVTLGKLKIMAGLRLEDTYFWITGWQVDSTTGVITPVTYHKTYGNALPTAIFTYEFDPKTIARASWSNTLARPDYSGTVPGRTVDDVNHLVTQGNAQLDPLQAVNWDASLEHYYAPLGVVSAAVFYKSIKNFAYQAQSGTDPSTGYLLTTYFNGPSAWIYGLELNWSQRFGFLPPPFNGLGVSANALLGDSQATYPTRPGETLPFTGFAEKAGNAALTYDRRGLHLQAALNYHGPRLESGSVIGANATQDQYEDKYITLDVGTSYSFAQHWQIYLNGANLNNAPLKEYYGGTGSLKRIQTYEAYGWSADGGIRWTF
jgi:TonB-dependent receptor